MEAKICADDGGLKRQSYKAYGLKMPAKLHDRLFGLQDSVKGVLPRLPDAGASPGGVSAMRPTYATPSHTSFAGSVEPWLQISLPGRYLVALGWGS
jgi:hypothetical protein